MKIDKLDEVTILFDIFQNNSWNCLLNHLIILGKYTLYLYRCKNIKPSLSLLKAKITETRKLELSIAKKNKKRIYSLQKMAKHVIVTFLFLKAVALAKFSIVIFLSFLLTVFPSTGILQKYRIWDKIPTRRRGS